ncbi:hypothetical protein DNTS_021544 [Danionella cerebrum]|uniref:E3 ubiquitin-protein ligase XIAP n=1 Tax=Danionella cerebrum TaxID=2873325 RepID=A0A553RFK1_9TELE|nr:hypothetical protein DNTS_021544 [Danionella translucida]
MAYLGYNGELESDGDWSSMVNRVKSFERFPHSDGVSAQRLARAGFYFTGDGDRVRCFSCSATVQDWHRGDAPLERHQQASPECRFLSCAHGMRNSTSSLGPDYDEDAESRAFLLRTGEVVDESIYPIMPHMKSEEARLSTFSSWPANIPVRPEDLAEAGMFSIGTGDGVQCFCCGGSLNGWEEGDDAWAEHAKYYPNCFFILGHNVGNVPMTTPRPRVTNSVSMETFEGRLGSFSGREHPIDPERLARAGFYSTGEQDRVMCFRCGGGLKEWAPDEDPWEEHARQYPGCSFLLAEKGDEYINRKPSQNGFSSHERCSFNETRMQDSEASAEHFKADDPLSKLEELQREKLCKVCMDGDIGIVFIPCGHLVTCQKCSEALNKCPICCATITQKVKTYNA